MTSAIGDEEPLAHLRVRAAERLVPGGMRAELGERRQPVGLTRIRVRHEPADGADRVVEARLVAHHLDVRLGALLVVRLEDGEVQVVLAQRSSSRRRLSCIPASSAISSTDAPWKPRRRKTTRAARISSARVRVLRSIRLRRTGIPSVF